MTNRTVATVGWDGASQPIYRYRNPDGSIDRDSVVAFRDRPDRDDLAAQDQERIDRLRTRGELTDAIHAAIDQQLGDYPQYKDHGREPEWQLGQITRLVRTKRGVAFRTGDAVLYRDDPHAELDDEIEHIAYSVRNGIDTAIPANAVAPMVFDTSYRHPNGFVRLEG